MQGRRENLKIKIENVLVLADFTATYKSGESYLDVGQAHHSILPSVWIKFNFSRFTTRTIKNFDKANNFELSDFTK